MCILQTPANTRHLCTESYSNLRLMPSMSPHLCDASIFPWYRATMSARLSVLELAAAKASGPNGGR